MRASIVTAVLASLLLAAAWQPHARTANAAGDCTTDPSLDAQEQAFLVLINNHRAANGRAPLSVSYTLSKAAQWKSEHMSSLNYFAHDDTPIGRSWSQRIRDCGHTWSAALGENIAAGNFSADATFMQWKNSAGHNQNMLNSSFTSIGIGRANSSGSTYGWYWTTEFSSYNDGFVSVAEDPPPPPPPTQPAPPPASQIEPPATPTSPPPPTPTVVPPTAVPPTPTASPAAPTTSKPLVIELRAPWSKRKHRIVIAGATVTGGAAIQRVEFYVDGAIAAVDTRAPYVAAMRVPADAKLISVRAVDAAGATAQDGAFVGRD